MLEGQCQDHDLERSQISPRAFRLAHTLQGQPQPSTLPLRDSRLIPLSISSAPLNSLHSSCHPSSSHFQHSSCLLALFFALHPPSALHLSLQLALFLQLVTFALAFYPSSRFASFLQPSIYLPASSRHDSCPHVPYLPSSTLPATLAVLSLQQPQPTLLPPCTLSAAVATAGCLE